MVAFIVGALIVMLGLVIGWHILFPLLIGGAIIVTAGAWGFIIATILLFCFCTLLVFIVTGIGALILGLLFLIWAAIAIVLFPILFPIIIPLFIIFLFVSYFRRKEKNKSGGQ